MRNGKARIPNSAMACTSSPVVTAPDDTRHAPSQRSAMVPRLGRASRPGSKPARSRPTTSRSRRRSSARCRSRSTSRSSRPERLHHEGALEALVGDRRHVADAGLRGGGGPLDPLRVGVVEEGEAREQRERHREQHGVDERQLHHRHDDDHDHAERERERLHGHRRPLAVGVGVGEQLAGGVLVEPPERDGEVAVGDALEPQHLHAPLGHLPEVAAEHHADHPAAARRPTMAAAPRHGGPALDPALLEGGGEDVVGDAAEHDRAAHRHDREQGGARPRRGRRGRAGCARTATAGARRGA